jgi:HlyD family secretion protein
MRKFIFIMLLAAVLAGAAFYAWQKPRAKDDEAWLGYVEGESLYIAAPVAGTLAAMPARRGDVVSAMAELFTLNPVSSDAETNRLIAGLAEARARLDNLRQQRQRQPEIAVAQARQMSARAEVRRAQQERDRVARLAKDGFATKARLDSAEASLQVALASLAQTDAEISSGKMPSGRSDEVRAAQAGVSAAEAALLAQRQRRSEISPVAPQTGLVEQTFFNVGEWVPANTPVLALLPDSMRKIRFFVPQDQIASIKSGMHVRVGCDGCGSGGGDGVIRYIAPRAEFTPPVIYSERARAKLVFMVEAQLPDALRTLPAGLPVDVALMPAPR